MGTADVPTVITLATAEVAIDATAAPAYDGQARHKWQFGVPAPYESAAFEFGVDLDATDTSLDVLLRNFTDSSDLASVTSITSDTDHEYVTFDPTDVDSGDELGLRINVDTASGTTGAEADVTGRIILRP